MLRIYLWYSDIICGFGLYRSVSIFDLSVNSDYHRNNLMETLKCGKIEWVHIENPSKKDMEFLKKNFNFHPIILDELLQPSTRSRVERYNQYLFMPYHFPVYDRTIKNSRRAEIDFLITKNSVITVSYERLEAVQNMRGALLNNASMHVRVKSQGTGLLVYYLIQEIINFSLRQLRHVQEKIESVNSQLFKGTEDELLGYISHLKSDVLEYQIVTRPQQIILESLREIGEKFWGLKMKVYLTDLTGDFMKIIQLIELHKEAIDGLETTNAQLLNVKTNKVMQRFTVLAFLTFPLMLLVALLDIDAISRSMLGGPYDFWIIFGGVAIIVAVMSIYFKKKGWL